MQLLFTRFTTFFLLTTIISVLANNICPPITYNAKQERYIVFLKDNKVHYNWLKECYNRSVKRIENIQNYDSKSTILDFSVEGKLFEYTTWYYPEFVENHLKNHPEIILIEKSMSIGGRSNYITQYGPPPNLDRIDQLDFPLNEKYIYPSSAGSNVTVYVLDTYIFLKLINNLITIK
jgi:hypothetical protein